MKSIISRSVVWLVVIFICLCMPSYAVQGLTVTDDLGDFCFFKSDYITHRYTAYPNLSSTLKGNDIDYEKFDYKNPDKGDRIIFNKTVTNTASANDMFIDITAKIFSTYQSSKVYSNFKLSGEFMCDFEGDFGDGRTAFIYQLRDSQSASSNIDIYPITVYSDGTLQLIDGTRLTGIAGNKRWFAVEMYVNLSEHTVTMFIDGSKVIDNKKCLAESFKKLNMTRVQVRSGGFNGQLQCRKMEFMGLDKPYNGAEIRTSMFGDDSEIEAYLADKLAFHHYGNLYYSNGKKTALTTPSVYKDGDIYVSIDDFNSAFGTSASISGDRVVNKGVTALRLSGAVYSAGQRLVPAGQLASALFDYYILDDTNGLVLISPTETEFDISAEVPYHKRKIHTGTIDRLSSLQYIYDYLLFDRPSKETLLDGFNSATNNGTAHPRVLATQTDFDNIRSLWQTDEYMKLIVDGIISKADSYITTGAIYFKYDDDLRMLNMANKLRDAMLYVGFAYQMTSDKKYSDWVWKNLDALNSFPDINPGHPIDTGSYGAGIAIGYDWCYHAFDEAQLANIEMNAKRLHLTVIYDGFYGRSPVRGGPDGNINVIGYYNKWISNYNIWTNYGSVMMSAAFMDTYPELCSDLMAHSIRSLEYGFKNLYPDGAWVESTNYWEVVADGMAYIFGTLNTLYGTDFNLSKFPGVSKTGITHMSLRSMVSTYNYHDANPSTNYAGYNMAFLGKYFNLPELSAARYAVLTKAFDKRQPTAVSHPVDALYFDQNVDVSKISDLPMVYTAEGLELFAVHEDYTDYDGLFFASHGGPVSFYHAHNDCGDFVFDLNGVRWAESLGYEDYNSALSGSERYRHRTEGHNTVTINNDKNFNQSENTYAPMIRHGHYLNNAFAVYDMSDLYADADSYYRGFHIDTEQNVLTIRDEIELNKSNSEIYWFMHTKADVELINETTARLTRNGESVVLNFETNVADAVMSVMDATPLPSSPIGAGQNANDGYRKIAIRLVADGKVNLTVRLAENGIIHKQDSSLYKVKSGDTSYGGYSIDSGVLKITKAQTQNSYEIRYGEGKFAGGLPTNGNYILSLNMKTDFSLKQGLQLAFGGHFEFACTDTDTQALRIRYYNGSEWVDVAQNRLFDFGEYNKVEFVAHRDTCLTDLYVGGELVIKDVPFRENQSDYNRLRIIVNKSAALTAYIKDIKVAEKSGIDIDSSPICYWNQPEITYSFDDDAVNISAVSPPWCKESTVYAAYYNGNSLVGIQDFKGFSDCRLDQSCDVKSGIDRISLFLWDGIHPLCDGIKLNIK